MAPDYVNLTLLQKVEVFQYALDNTTGQDLYRALWLGSDNSEAWLGRRETYTRSMAVNSMVGHILGLGDRHPSNVLLDRASGKVVHIDFGDCFEVAMTREKFPERIPFRLTRMVVNAMEVRRCRYPELTHPRALCRFPVSKAASGRRRRSQCECCERIMTH